MDICERLGYGADCERNWVCEFAGNPDAIFDLYEVEITGGNRRWGWNGTYQGKPVKVYLDQNSMLDNFKIHMK